MISKPDFLKTTWIKHSLFLVNMLTVFLSLVNTLQATHIVGGQLTYRHLGNNKYEVTIIFRRDCKLGADTVPFDNPALLGIFYGDGMKAFRIGNDGVVPMKQLSDDTLRQTVQNVCVGRFEEVCVHEAMYRDTIVLLPDPRGYILAYQRCCRNRSLLNIVDPEGTGGTYTAFVQTPSPVFEGNSNPVFGDFPPIYVCANKPFTFNHSAIDPDRDSLVYELCTPYLGKTKLEPAGRPSFPPYDTVTWLGPTYDLSKLIGSPVLLDRNSGLLTAMPTMHGQYLIGICVYEYRQGVLLGYSRRDFEINVIPCGLLPEALFERNSDLCDGLKVSFNNKSINGTDYTWYFDWLNDKSLTSKNFNPAFTYTKPGSYEVVLITKNGDCEDTSRQNILVINPELHADFDYSIDCSDSVLVQVTDHSSANYPITNREWKLTSDKDTIVTDIQNPLFRLLGDGNITITLNLIDSFGCQSTIQKNFMANLIEIDFPGENPSICRGDSVKLVKNPKTQYKYHWEPGNSLNSDSSSNPTARPNLTTSYTVTITDGPCSTVKQITVYVRDKIEISLSADTSVCNGFVDLEAKSDTATTFTWSYDPDFDPVRFIGDHFRDSISGTRTYYVYGGHGEQCPDSASITITDHSINLNYNNSQTACAGDTIKIQLSNNNISDNVTIKWTPDSNIISSLDSFFVIVVYSKPGKYKLYFTARNQFDCTYADSIIVNIVQPPNPDFRIDNDCGSLKVTVQAEHDGKVIWDFGDGNGTSTDRISQYTYQKHGKYIITLTIDSVCHRSLSKEVTVVELILNLKDTVIACFGESVQLNPQYDTAYKYIWTPKEGLDNASSPNPTASVSNSTWYYVTIFDPDFPDSCSLTDSLFVFVPPALQLKAERDTILCEKTSIMLKVNANIQGTVFEWYNAADQFLGNGSEIQVTPDHSTYYYVKAKDPFGCFGFDTVHVQLFELDATLTGLNAICIGDSVFIKVIAGTDNQYTFEWLPKELIIGSNTDSIIWVNPKSTTTFTVKIRNEHNCEWELTHTIQVSDPQSELNVKAEPPIIVPGQKSQLTATFKTGWKYLWKPLDGTLSDSSIHNPTASPVVTTSYTVTVTDENGCTATAVVTVTVQTCIESVFLPNAFSPNADHVNDTLYVRSRPNTITRMELIIYNRWGEQVFSTTDINKGWDGKFDGEELPPDVFGYALKFTCPDNREIIKKGNINLLK